MEPLEYINKIRKATGLEPLEDIEKGKRRLKNQCPIARSVGLDDIIVVSLSITLILKNQSDAENVVNALRAEGIDCIVSVNNDKWVVINSPPSVKKWITEFDDGQHSEYLM